MKTYQQPFSTRFKKVISAPMQGQYIFEQTLDPCFGSTNDDDQAAPVTFLFDVSGINPTGPATLTVEACGDIDEVTSGAPEFYTIEFEGDELSPTIGEENDDDCLCVTEIYQLSASQIQEAASDGTIKIRAIPVSEEGDVDCGCDNNVENRVSVTLQLS